MEALLQLGEPPGKPLCAAAQSVEHGLIEHRPEKHDGAPVDDKPQDDQGDDARVLRLELGQHVDKGHHRAQHKGALEAKKLDEQHRGGHPGGDLIPQQVGGLHGLAPGGAGGDIGVVEPQQANFLAGPEFHGDLLAAHEQADELPLEQQVHQHHYDSDGQKARGQVGDGLEHIAKLLVEQPEQQHRHNGGADIDPAPGDLPLFPLGLPFLLFQFHNSPPFFRLR